MATIKRGTARRLGLRRPAKALRITAPSPWQAVGEVPVSAPTFRELTANDVAAAISARLGPVVGHAAPQSM
jgi:hypothetical protein